MTITILTPTFNDEHHFPELINSVFSQTYTTWQWIIINDGSTDGTEKLLDSLDDPRIKIIHQDNRDQLNALRTAIPYIQGDIVCMMHSDDRFVSQSTLGETATSLIDSGCEGIYADYKLIDKDNKYTGTLYVPQKVKSDIALDIIQKMGDNPIGDHFFVTRKAFFSHIVPNYITQNTIYYLNYQNLKPLNLKKILPWYCYRVFDENYINSEIGKFVAISGQFRTTSRIFKTGINFSGNTIYGYSLFRLLRKIHMRLPPPGTKANLGASQYFEYWAKDLDRYHYPELLFQMARAISRSFSSQRKKSKSLMITPQQEHIYTPAEARQFYKDHTKGVIPDIYYKLIHADYDFLEVKTAVEKDKLQKILDFLSLQYAIKIA